MSDPIRHSIERSISCTSLLIGAEVRAKGGSRYGIHWSDRKDPPPPTLNDLISDGLTHEELKDIGYTDKELEAAHRGVRVP